MQVSYSHNAHVTELGTIADATEGGSAITDSRRNAMLVVYSDDDGDGTKTLTLPDDGEITIGRSRASTIHVDSERVSRNHAIIRRDDEGVTVEELKSRNGTRLNGARIEGTYTLQSGDELQIGPVTIILHLPSPSRRRIAVGSTGYLDERLGAEAERGLRYKRNFALVMLRIEADDETADVILEHLARRLRRMDVIAEYGPDDFAFLLPELDQKGAEQAARRLLGEVRVAGAELRPPRRVTAHIGIAVFPQHGTRPGNLLNRARDALRLACEKGEVDIVATPPEEAQPSGEGIVVGDPKMRRVYDLAARVGNTSMTALIIGETGAGKELLAEEIHRCSERRHKRFLRLNCASIPETLLERELFGNERGAFTGADKQSKGFFEAADGGTIFLDEIGEISMAMQGKLLRVLEERRFMRVGGTEEVEVDVRVVCATNRDLETEVSRGRFREDLFFRISAFTIVVPPLRDRRPEIPLFAKHFIERTARELRVSQPEVSDRFMAALEQYHWPGNVRELRNAIERALVVHREGPLEPAHLPDRIREEASGAPDVAAAASPAAGRKVDVREQLAAVERAAIVAALEACGGNQTRAAEKLGLSRRALIYKMEKYGLKRAPAR